MEQLHTKPKPFNFLNNIFVSAQSLIHVINMHGKDLIGIEVGTGEGANLCTLIQNCQNIKKLYGVDPYLPYGDYIREKYDGETLWQEFSQKHLDFLKNRCYLNIANCQYTDKLELIEKKSIDVCKEFSDEYFDFIFLDAYIDEESVINDLENWYPKLKRGGLFSGHDIECDMIEDNVLKFAKKHNKEASIFNSCWAWIK
tara:strand:- start:251 stop:847 length:597 start_codon:yes stop_codon:yes gene_type:complete